MNTRLWLVLSAMLWAGCSDPRPPQPQRHDLAHPSRETCPLCHVYDATKRGVVKITTDQGNLGSGVLVARDGLVVTAYHVVQGASRVKIVLLNGKEYYAAVQKFDASQDLALLRMQDSPEGLEPILLEDRGDVREGMAVLVIGHPMGMDWTLTTGIISRVRGAGVIQTDAGVSPGNSGGPLLDAEGHCIGIIVSKVVGPGAESIGFARPSGIVREFLSRP